MNANLVNPIQGQQGGVSADLGMQENAASRGPAITVWLGSHARPGAGQVIVQSRRSTLTDYKG